MARSSSIWRSAVEPPVMSVLSLCDETIIPFGDRCRPLPGGVGSRIGGPNADRKTMIEVNLTDTSSE
jgi:hypothetical protein